jgi:hypothetical protein
MCNKEAEWFDKMAEPLKGQYWFRMGIFNTHRFSVDVYAFLRMFRAKEKQSDRWSNAHRFENIIFHGGLKHVEGIRHLLLNLNKATAKFTQVHEAVYHPVQRNPGFIFNLGIMMDAFGAGESQRVRCRVDFLKFVVTITAHKGSSNGGGKRARKKNPIKMTMTRKKKKNNKQFKKTKNLKTHKMRNVVNKHSNFL